MNCSMPGLPVHHQLLESTQTHVHWVGDAIQPSHPLSSPSPPALNLSQRQGLFQWVSSSPQVAKRLVSASTSVLPMTPRMIPFRMDWLYLLVVQGTLKSLLQYHSSKASILRCSAFFIVQLSHPYMTTGKTIALTRQYRYTKEFVYLFIWTIVRTPSFTFVFFKQWISKIDTLLLLPWWKLYILRILLWIIHILKITKEFLEIISFYCLYVLF